MSEFEDPKLIHFATSPSAREAPPPIFAFKLRVGTADPAFARAVWIKKTSSDFAIHAVRLSPLAPSGVDAETVVLGGALTYVWGPGRAAFRSTFNGAAYGGALPLLPSETEIESWFPTTQAGLRRQFCEKLPAIRETFCRAVVAHFSDAHRQLATGQTARFASCFKGLTVGRSRNEAGFLMMALKLAYDRLSFYQQTYSGARLSDFALSDLLAYAESHRRGYSESQIAALVLAPVLPSAMPTDPTEADAPPLPTRASPRVSPPMDPSVPPPRPAASIPAQPPTGLPMQAPVGIPAQPPVTKVPSPALPVPPPVVVTQPKAAPSLVRMHDPTGWTKRQKPAPSGGPPDAGPFVIRVHSPSAPGIPQEYLDMMATARRHWVELQAKTPGTAVVPVPLQPDTRTTDKTFKTSDIVIVHEYGFRGDTRPPPLLFESGGFHPNGIYWDPDDHDSDKIRRELARLIADAEATGDASEAQRLKGQKGYFESRVAAHAKLAHGKHKGAQFDPLLHVSEEYNALSVFLSVSRSPDVGSEFLVLRGKGTGFIYAMRCDSAIDQLATYTHGKTQTNGTSGSGREFEISVPGGVDWCDVIAYRAMTNSVLADHAFVNEANPWRAKETVLQDRAIAALLAL